jgi:ribose transport system permease protein
MNLRLGELRSNFDWRRNIIYIGFIFVFLFFAVTQFDRGFLTWRNVENIINQTATITVMAVAMTFVIGAAQIDLSVGSVVGLASVTTAMAIAEFGVPVGIAAGLLTGAIVGAVNGALVAYVAIPAFLVTLGMLGIAHGAAMWITDTAPQPILDEGFNDVFGSGELGPFSVLVYWSVLAAIIGHVLLRKTGYGRRVLATGGNPVAARFSGVDTRRITFAVLAVMGVVSAFAGMLLAGRLHSGRYTFGEGFELSVIAAVILGGTSLFGGRATVIGSVLGSLMIGVINTGLTLMGMESSQQQIVRGAIIILAVALARR